MIFRPTNLAGAFVIDLEKREDARGDFARAFCEQEFKDQGIDFKPVQANLSHTLRKGTLRGMHYQIPPAGEAKLVRCTQGAMYDVIIDMRPDSPTYLEHFGIELSSSNGTAIFIPPLFAHGYQAMCDNMDAMYLVSEFYTPGCERGLRYDDPDLGIKWPIGATLVSEKDKEWPLLKLAR